MANVIAAASGRPFSWGRRNCALFAADAVLAMTGWDAAARVRGRFASRRGALLSLARYGAGDVATLMERVAAGRGLPEIAPGFAQRGDAVLVATEDGLAIGICAGLAIVVPGRSGLAHLPRARGVKAWRIG